MRTPLLSGTVRPLSLALIGLVALGGPAIAKDWRLTIRPAGHVRAGTPVTLPAPDGVEPGSYTLHAESSTAAAPAVVAAEDGKQTLTVVLPELSGTSTFLLKKHAEAFSPDKGVVFVPRGLNLEINLDGKPFTVYRVDAGAKPFLFPLIGPTGDPYTRSYPMEKTPGEDEDHPHQRSFWFTHGKVNDVDFWSEMKNHGTIKETSRTIATASPILGRLTTRDDWVGPDGKKVCEDERTLTVYNAGSVRVLDFAVKLKASEGPVVMGDTKEGMFGLRVASSMDVDRKTGGKIRNAEGLEDAKAWGKPSPWVDYTGPVNGKTVGIAVLNHPRSLRFPTTWHVRTYGLFAANPFGWHDFGMPEKGDYTIPKGESAWFGYRVILHDGDGASAGIADHYASYATPPNVEWAMVD